MCPSGLAFSRRTTYDKTLLYLKNFTLLYTFLFSSYVLLWVANLSCASCVSSNFILSFTVHECLSRYCSEAQGMCLAWRNFRINCGSADSCPMITPFSLHCSWCMFTHKPLSNVGIVLLSCILISQAEIENVQASFWLIRLVNTTTHFWQYEEKSSQLGSKWWHLQCSEQKIVPLITACPNRMGRPKK